MMKKSKGTPIYVKESLDIIGLREIARKHIEHFAATDSLIPLPHELLSTDTRSTSLASLVELLHLSDSNEDRQKSFENIIILEACLSNGTDVGESPSRQDAAILLCEWVANAILPPRAFAETSPYSAEERPALTPDVVAKEHALSLHGLSLLSHLQEIIPLSSQVSRTAVYTCLTSFSEDSDPWVSSEAEDLARSLAEDIVVPEKISEVIYALLQEKIRPLFAKVKNPAVTQQGRKAIDPLRIDTTAHSDMDVETKPWKYRDMYIVTVFQWVLKHLDETSMEANWPLIIPPLLALIDDSSIQYKAKGCAYLSIFLQSCPSPLLGRTGLGEVFENAVTPCLMYLPSLTEEAESLHLLSAAYPALISLARVRFVDEKQRDAKLAALDRILRYGILAGYGHAGDHVRIAELLINQTVELINEMGIASVKHLKHLLPLLSAILAAPFATAYPPLLEASTKALEAVMVNDWPRIANHRGEILRGLTTCWCQIKDEETRSKGLAKVQKSIERSVRLLTLLTKKNVDIAADYQMLIDSNHHLRNLLIV